MVFRKIPLVRVWSIQWSDLIHGVFVFFFYHFMTLIQKGISRVQEGLSELPIGV